MKGTFPDANKNVPTVPNFERPLWKTAQSGGQTKDVTKPAKNFKGDTQAFTLNDFRFETHRGRRLRGAAVLSVPLQDLKKGWARYRTQKNGDNGAERLLRKRALARLGVASVYLPWRTRHNYLYTPEWYDTTICSINKPHTRK